ncbi:hypothetical protein CSM95_000791 [Salmonella enterica subsp. houtenae]|nr:hypothetical protein [Salmonella enterica subsp. houtenae]EDY1249890.1 hypothetical protein [Salmonella enterica]
MFAIALQWQCLSEISSRFGGVGGCPIWLQISPYDVSAHNVIRVMLKRPLRKSNPAAAFLHITSLCASGLIHVSDCSNFRRVAVRGSVTPELYRGFPR